MTRLALTVPHLPGETITSFISRTAYRNGYDSAGIFCGDVGLDWKAIIRGDDRAFHEVASLTGAASGRLFQSSVRSNVAGKLLIGDETGTQTLIKKSTPRVCPACLVEDRDREGRFGGAGRVTWSVIAIHRCHLHGHRLMPLAAGASPVSNSDLHPIIRSNWPLIVAHADHIPAGPAETSLESYLRGRISGEHAGIWPDQLPLYVAARTSEMFGCRLRFGAGQVFRNLDPDQMRAAGSAGFDVLSGGPERLCDALRDLEHAADEEQPFHHRVYGRFFTWLSESRTSGDFDPIKDIVRDHIVANYPLEEGAIILGEPMASRRLYTIEAARRELNIGVPRLKQLLHDRGIAGKMCNRRFPALTEDEFFALRQDLDRWLSAAEASTMLGITASQVRKLIVAGTFRSTRLRGRKLLCARRDVEEVLSLIENLPVGPKDGYRTIRSVLAGGAGMASIVDCH